MFNDTCRRIACALCTRATYESECRSVPYTEMLHVAHTRFVHKLGGLFVCNVKGGEPSPPTSLTGGPCYELGKARIYAHMGKEPCLRCDDRYGVMTVRGINHG